MTFNVIEHNFGNRLFMEIPIARMLIIIVKVE